MSQGKQKRVVVRDINELRLERGVLLRKLTGKGIGIGGGVGHPFAIEIFHTDVNRVGNPGAEFAQKSLVLALRPRIFLAIGMQHEDRCIANGVAGSGPNEAQHKQERRREA